MKIDSAKKIIQALILMVTVSVTLIITPTMSSEPVDQPKMTLMFPFAMALLFLLVANTKKLILEINKVYLVFVLVFLAQLTLVLVFSGSPFNQQFYGTFGRNTGFLSYLALALIAIASAWSANIINILRIVYSLLLVGGISIGYSIMQTFGVDPIKWNNPYNSILAFLGNPNFASSFTGICCVAAFSLSLRNNLNRLRRFLLASYMALGILVMYRSGSQQGILVFGVGSIIVFFTYLRGSTKFNKKSFKAAYISAAGIGMSMVILGTINTGPLASHLYKISVRQRGFYWQAAKKMMLDHPFFGVGLDSYGDWYFKYRSLNAAFHTPVTQSNAAHNVYLEFGSNGGAPLFFLYLSVVIITAISGWKLLSRQSDYNWVFSGLVAAWVAYQAQALISINQLGLAIWGWVLSGSIVGIEFNTRLKNGSETKTEERKRISSKVSKGGGGNFSLAAIGFVIGALVVAPVFLNDANYRKTLQTGNANLLIAATLKSPEDTGRTLQAAQILLDNKLTVQGIELAKHIVQVNPRSFNAWTILAGISKPGSPDYVLAHNKLKALNPKIQIK